MCPTLLRPFDLRAAVVAEARSWLRTPYILGAAVKGAGVDCGLLPYCVYRKFGLLSEFIPEGLTDDWFAHTTKEKYLLMVERRARRAVTDDGVVAFDPRPGDLALVKAGGARVFNHAGIVTCWPHVIHAGTDIVSETNTMSDLLWWKRKILVFDFITECSAK